MNLTTLVKTADRALRSNSPGILTAMGVTGTLTTAYLATKAGMKHARYMRDEGPNMSVKEETKLVWKFYIPPVLSASVTVASIVGASRVGSRRTAALTAAYSLSEKAFSEYKEKVIEKFGEGKERSVRDEIAQDRVTRDANVTKEILISGGNILCCELFTGRYFESDMERLRKAQNDLNNKLVNGVYASIDDFYHLLGLPGTSCSGDIGWESDKLLELQFTTTLSDDGRPCLAFDYNYTRPI